MLNGLFVEGSLANGLMLWAMGIAFAVVLLGVTGRRGHRRLLIADLLLAIAVVLAVVALAVAFLD